MKSKAFLCFALGAGVMGAASSLAGELVAERILSTGMKNSISPVTGEGRQFTLRRLAPISKTRFLAFFDMINARPQARPFTPTPERPVGPPLKVLQEGYILAILSKEGKVVAQGPPLPKVKGLSVPGAGRFCQPVPMEDEPQCPYGLLRRDTAEFVCFDWQLQPTGKHQVPLARVWAAQAVTGGKHVEVWIFGEQEVAPTGEAAGPPSLADDFRPKAQGTAVLRLVPATGEVFPLPELFSQVQREAKRLWGQELGRGKRVVGARFDPLLSFTGAPGASEVQILVTVTWDEGADDADGFSGEKSFFLASLTPQGLGTARPLPLRFVHEPGRQEVELVPETGVLRVPAASWFQDVQAFAGSPGRVVLYFMLLQAPEGLAKARESRTYEAMGFLFSCDPLSCEEVLEEGLEKASALKTAEVGVTTTDQLLGPLGPWQLAFGALCWPGGQAKPEGPQDCAAVLRLGP